MLSDLLILKEYMGVESLSTPILLKPKETEDNWPWFQYLLSLAVRYNQNNKCICDAILIGKVELHHALISRQDVRGHPQNYLIHHPYNVLLLHNGCHNEATREQCFQFLGYLYGYDNVREWHNSFPFKSKFRRI